MAERTKGELAFIDQYTRKLLVAWGHASLYDEFIPDIDDGDQVYLEQALVKGWVSKKTPHKLTAKGWATAASFLKR